MHRFAQRTKYQRAAKIHGLSGLEVAGDGQRLPLKSRGLLLVEYDWLGWFGGIEVWLVKDALASGWM